MLTIKENFMKKVLYKDSGEFLKALSERDTAKNKEVTDIVTAITENVRINGDTAVKDYTLKFDGSLPRYYEVPAEVISDALTAADEKFVNALLNAIENITEFHKNQVDRGFIITKENGVILGQKVRGLERVGLYVPGGKAAYPSSVLMNTIPAKIAGVKEVIMVTPPLADGTPNKDILVAAALCGVDRIFLMGGAQAVAALAYGTESVPKVDKIVGPGNIFVATAKKLLFGTVDIDMIAGPSEILVLADETANPAFIAADLMSQAEHDVLASAILVTTSEKIAVETLLEIEKQIQNLSRKEIIEKSLNDYGAVIICENMVQALEISEKIAPEHLEVLLENPLEYIGRINNAGSVFLGHFSSESLGDYYAGANHVLPTSGTARFFSPLGVSSFYKRSSYIYYTEQALKEVADDIVLIAEREALTAHANSITIRVGDREQGSSQE
jgi:histidinol dehydrogenase